MKKQEIRKRVEDFNPLTPEHYRRELVKALIIMNMNDDEALEIYTLALRKGVL